MSDIKVNFGAVDSGLVRETMAVATAAGQVDKNYKDAASSAGQFERMAKKAFQDSLAPAEKYRHAIAQLDDLLRREKITQEEYAAAVKKTGEQYEEAKNKGEQAFGPMAVRHIGTMIGSLSLMHIAQQSIVSVLREEADLRRQAADASKEAERSIEALAQLATPKLNPGETLQSIGPEERRRRTVASQQELISGADRLWLAGAANTRGEAAEQMFSIASAGLSNDLKLFTDLASSGLIPNLSSLTTAINTMVTNFGVTETGDARAIVNKAIQAASSTPVPAQDLLKGASRGAASAKEMGLSDEELLAAQAIMTSSRGSAEEGGSYLAALMKVLSKGFVAPDGRAVSFSGKSLEEAFQQISDLKMSPADLHKTVGDASAVQSYQVITSKMDDYRKFLADIRNSQQLNPIDDQMFVATEGDPKTSAARLARIAAVRQAASNEDKFSVTQSLLDEVASYKKKEFWQDDLGMTFHAIQGIRNRVMGLMPYESQLQLARADMAAISLSGDKEATNLLSRIEALLARIDSKTGRDRQPTAKSETGK